MARLRVLALDATHYQRHALHAESLAWAEKNCYVDVIIEVVHAAGCEPLAMLPFVSAIDFEGDQWTFYKPSHDELYELYGIGVQEMSCYKPLVEHAVEHLGAGRLIATEADAWWMPDVAATDYRRAHVKSTIVLNDLDVAAQRLGYFHNAGYYTLEGEDFERTFAERTGEHMPFFAELVKLDRKVVRPPSELRAISLQLLAKHAARRPTDNPVRRFATRFERDLPGLVGKGLAHYHVWAFATVRQLGSAAELMAQYLRWLGDGRDDAVAAYEAISTGAKTFILKGARAVNGKKPFDPSAMFDEWARAWDVATGSL